MPYGLTCQLKGHVSQALVSYIYLFTIYIHKERSLSVSRRLPQFTVEKNVLEFLNDLKFILYLKYDNILDYIRSWII